MDIQEIKKRIKAIEKVKDDDEHAHILEDRLYYKFVAAIIKGKYNSIDQIREIAQEIRKVRKIDFDRWHA